jgi:hypothetical protein
MDLAIQPREGDLVIATHGRALYVLDDVSPLREVDAKSLAEPLHLFPVANARQHSVAPGGGTSGAGSGEFRGENEPYGALLTYSLNLPGLPLPDAEKERERKQRERTEAAKARPPAPEAKPEKEARQEDPAATGKAEKREEEAQEKPEEESDEPGRGRGKDKEPKVEIVITDAAGREVRTFEGPAKLGINRIPWDLTRNLPRQPPRDTQQRFREPTGPEVPPGRYEVTVRFRGQEAKSTVTVLPDPAVASQPESAWADREAALARAGKLQDALVEAIERLRQARADVGSVLDRLAHREEEAKRARGAAAHEEKKDEKKEPDPLTKAGRKLQRALDAEERKLWHPPDTKGILPDDDVLSKVEAATGSLESTWQPPDATYRTRLDQAEAAVTKALAEVNHLFESDVAAFRQQVEAAGIRLLNEEEPIQIEGVGPAS